jgi:hypothetical protein
MSGRHNVNPPSRTPLCRLWIIHLVAGRRSAKAVKPSGGSAFVNGRPLSGR